MEIYPVLKYTNALKALTLIVWLTADIAVAQEMLPNLAQPLSEDETLVLKAHIGARKKAFHAQTQDDQLSASLEDINVQIEKGMKTSQGLQDLIKREKLPLTQITQMDGGQLVQKPVNKEQSSRNANNLEALGKITGMDDKRIDTLVVNPGQN